MFYKPDGGHFIFKNKIPRWICKLEEEDFENYELFDKILGKMSCFDRRTRKWLRKSDTEIRKIDEKDRF